MFNSNNTPATRPIITDGPSSAVDYGATFEIETPNAASIASVVAIRPGTPTHAFDMDQRMVRLSFTAGSGVLNVVAPPNGNIAPPGYYMVFILNSAGVPSTARFVQFLAFGRGRDDHVDSSPRHCHRGPATSPPRGRTSSTPLPWIGSESTRRALPMRSFLSWAYVNCLQTPGAAAASGSCALPGTSSLSPGTYQFRLFRNDGYIKLATSNNFAVSAPSGSATVTVTPPLCSSGRVGDRWVERHHWARGDGLVWPLQSRRAERVVCHLEVRQLHQTPTGPIPSGQCSLPLAATLAPGQYEIRLFRNDGFTLLGVSPAFTVTLPSPPTLTASPSTVVRGTAVTATWSGISGAEPDRLDRRPHG